MNLLNCLLLLVGLLLGGLIVYASMKVIHWYKKREEDLVKRIKDLEEQLKGKQLPYFVRDGLEDIKALENKDEFDLARMRLYLEEAMKTIDQAAERKKRMSEVYSSLRNHTKKKGD